MKVILRGQLVFGRGIKNSKWANDRIWRFTEKLMAKRVLTKTDIVCSFIHSLNKLYLNNYLV